MTENKRGDLGEIEVISEDKIRYIIYGDDGMFYDMDVSRRKHIMLVEIHGDLRGRTIEWNGGEFRIID